MKQAYFQISFSGYIEEHPDRDQATRESLVDLQEYVDTSFTPDLVAGVKIDSKQLHITILEKQAITTGTINAQTNNEQSSNNTN